MEPNAEIDPSLSRFVGVDDGISLWLVAPEGTHGICLMAYQRNHDWSVACGGSGLEVDMGSGPHFAVNPDGAPDREGLRRITENVFAISD